MVRMKYTHKAVVEKLERGLGPRLYQKKIFNWILNKGVPEGCVLGSFCLEEGPVGEFCEECYKLSSSIEGGAFVGSSTGSLFMELV
jgi:hypothetical protein